MTTYEYAYFEHHGAYTDETWIWFSHPQTDVVSAAKDHFGGGLRESDSGNVGLRLNKGVATREWLAFLGDGGFELCATWGTSVIFKRPVADPEDD